MIKIFNLLLITLAVFSLSTRLMYSDRSLAPAISAIEKLYEQEVNTLDSFLETYPLYFYDSSLILRQQKCNELTYLLKRTTSFFIYFEPGQYYDKIALPFQFIPSQKKGVWDVLPDNFLISGPIGVEADSVMAKWKKEDTLVAINFIKVATSNFRNAFHEINIPAHFGSLNAPGIFDALRVEIFRISTIDIANAEFWIEPAGLPALNGSIDAWMLFTTQLVDQLPGSEKLLREKWAALSGKTKQYLADNRDFRKFDRMFFIKNNLIPLSEFLNELQLSMKIPFVQKWSAIRANAKHIYDKNIFDADYFSPDENGYYSPEKARLGELLFFDPLLSDNNKRSCASCHKPGMAFTDGLKKSTSFEMTELPRNSPTVINSGFQKKQFWDMRAGSLEDQLDSVINNPHELSSSFENVNAKINASPEYVKLFHQAFPKTIKEGIQRQDIKNAIGVYERTLVGLNSRFDQYMQGDESKLSREELNGFNVYMGKAKCGSCHTAPLFSSALPPFFDITDHHSLGVPLKDTMVKYSIDPDKGVFASTKNPFTKFSFKVPTIRNTAVTAPFMHNGVYNSLERVIEFYNNGAGGKLSKDMRPGMEELPFFTVLPFPLELTATEKKELIAFIGALTDTTASKKVPERLPELRGRYQSLSKRKIGGEY